MASKHTTILPGEWCAYLSKLCKQFENQHPLPSAEMILGNCDISTPKMYLMPPVIIWSPLEQFLMLKGKVMCPKCSHPDSLLHASVWRDGTKGRRSEPRKIYGEDGVTLLVGRVYTCTKGHEVVGYHPGIIKQIATCFISFNLWHVTGFTKQITRTIFSLLTSGLSIRGIQSILSEKQTLWYCSQRLLNCAEGGRVHSRLLLNGNKCFHHPYHLCMLCLVVFYKTFGGKRPFIGNVCKILQFWKMKLGWAATTLLLQQVRI